MTEKINRRINSAFVKHHHLPPNEFGGMDMHGAIPPVRLAVWDMKRYHPIYWVEYHDIQASAEFIRRREDRDWEITE